MNRRRPIAAAALAGLIVALPAMASAQAPDVEKYLTEGRLAEGEQALSEHLKQTPDDQQARFGLGALRFLQAVERLGQSLHRYGALGPESRLGRQMPLTRLPVPANPRPEPIGYEDFRTIIQQLIDDLAEAEKTLAGIDDPSVKLPLHFGLIALDLNGDGKAGREETLWRIYATLNNGLRLSPDFTPEEVQNFVIGFDYGDVHWLRGYCHLLSAIGEVILAYDEQELFAAVAHQIFANPEQGAVPQELFPRKENRPWESDLADAIAAIHLAKFPLKDAERMKAAHEHLRQVIRHSRESWKAIEAEADNDNEWVPSGRQTGVIPGTRVTDEIVTGWHTFLDEAESILEGKKLLPHWRLAEGHGINLRKVFHEPREFDLVLWVHGAAAIPYIEQGPTTNRETWTRLNRVFGGQFIGFAFWFN